MLRRSPALRAGRGHSFRRPEIPTPAVDKDWSWGEKYRLIRWYLQTVLTFFVCRLGGQIFELSFHFPCHRNVVEPIGEKIAGKTNSQSV